MAADPPSVAPAGSLALYRKYRPATFAEVKGQEQVTEPLTRALRAGRLHHAYLFSGPRGCGKTTSARILARSLNCVKGPTPEPCGVCESCIALAPNGPGSIDVIEIDAASHGGVDDARELRERAFYAPVSGRFKVYIIDEAHMVTREGFNALLKLVEEPPAHLTFVFATTEPEKVIATIRSRTHHYPFRLVPPAVLRDLLTGILGQEGVRYEPEALQLVIRAGAGSVRDCLSVLDQLLAGSDEAGLTYEKTAFLLGYTDASLLDQVTEAFAAGDGAAAFHAVDRVMEAGLDPRRFAADLLDRLRDLIVLRAVPGAGQSGLIDAPADRLEVMTQQAASFGQAELIRAAEVLNEGLVQMRGATAPRLLLELICAQVLLPAAGEGHSALLARLERLERAQQAERPERGSVGGRPTVPEIPAAASEPAPAEPAAPAPPPAVPPGAAGEAGPPPAGASGAAQPAISRVPARDAESLRGDWEAVLDAVKGVRKVTWTLLQNASIQSLEEGVLTLTFASEGSAKGFAGNGSDTVLQRVLADSFGLAVQVRAFGQPGDAGPGGGLTGRTGSLARDPSAGLSRTVPLQSRASKAEPGAGATQDTAAGPGAGGAAPGRRGRIPDEGDPFDAADPDASAGEAAPAGMDLIKRELGGQVIEEIDNE